MCFFYYYFSFMLSGAINKEAKARVIMIDSYLHSLVYFLVYVVLLALFLSIADSINSAYICHLFIS